jgi:hypothetical protein
MRATSMAKLFIVFDTNAIYNPNHEDQFFAPEVERVIQDSTHAHLDLVWIIPRMVRLEREYAMRKKVKQIVALARNMPALYGETWVGDASQVHARISRLAESEMVRLNVLERSCDPALVDWNALMDAAGSRLPPFDPGDDREKGFKDAIVAETFAQLFGELVANGIDSTVLVTNDNLLREHVGKCLRSNCKILRNIDELATELNFLASDIPTEIAEKLPDCAKELLTGAGEFWERIWMMSKAEFPQHFSKSAPGLLSVRVLPRTFTKPSFLRKDMRRLYFTCRYLLSRVGKRYVPAEPYPDTLFLNQTFKDVSESFVIQSEGIAAQAGIPMLPVEDAPPAPGATEFGADTPIQVAMKIVSVQLPSVSVAITWSTEFDVKGASQDAVITLTSPRFESLDSVDYVMP